MTSKFWICFHFYYVKTKSNEMLKDTLINLKSFQINY